MKTLRSLAIIKIPKLRRPYFSISKYLQFDRPYNVTFCVKLLGLVANRVPENHKRDPQRE